MLEPVDREAIRLDRDPCAEPVALEGLQKRRGERLVDNDRSSLAEDTPTLAQRDSEIGEVTEDVARPDEVERAAGGRDRLGSAGDWPHLVTGWIGVNNLPSPGEVLGAWVDSRDAAPVPADELEAVGAVTTPDVEHMTSTVHPELADDVVQQRRGPGITTGVEHVVYRLVGEVPSPVHLLDGYRDRPVDHRLILRPTLVCVLAEAAATEYVPHVPQKYLHVGDVATLIHHRGPTTLPGQPPETDRGATIICLHDAGTNGRQFDGLMDHLAADHSPLAYDQPGHGRSASLDALPSVAAMVEHLASIVASWSLDDPVLVGEGLGATVALEAATQHPDRVRGLVLIGGAAVSHDLDTEIASLAAITSGKARREFDRSGYAPETDRSVYQTAFGNWVTTDPRATLGARRAQAGWSLAEPPPGVPTLVVVGEHEEAPSTEGAEALAERLPEATVERLAGAGRRGVLEQPNALGGTVTTFVTTLGNGARP